jgi:hypothetical protein
MNKDLHPITKSETKEMFPKMLEYNNMVNIYLCIDDLYKKYLTYIK